MMRCRWPLALLLGSAGFLAAAALKGMSGARAGDSGPDKAPPVAPLKAVTETYFGTTVSDPYRYMETLADPKVALWFQEQDAYTRRALSRIPARAKLLARIQQLERSGTARVFDVQRYRNPAYFYQKRLPGEDVSKLYERPTPGGPEKLVLDPDKYASKQGEHYTLSYYVPSLDGRYVAYGVAPAGSEDAVIHVLDRTRGSEAAESIDRSWYGGISWLPDGESFLHVRLQKLPKGADTAERRLKVRVYRHVLGTDPESDLAVFGYGVNSGIALDPADGCGVVSDLRSPYAIAYVNHGFSNDVTLYGAPVSSIAGGNAPWEKIVDVADQVVGFDLRGTDLYLVTHKEAPRSKVVRVSMPHPDLAHAAVVGPPSEAVVTTILAMADALYVQDLDGGIGRLFRVPYSGGAAERVPLPLDGSLSVA